MHGARIVVVDTETGSLEAGRRILEREGYLVTKVSSGPAAIDLALRGDFDLILTDLMTTTESSLDMVRAIKEKDPLTVHVAVVDPTALDLAIRALRTGTDDIILGPVSREELRKVVSSALARGRARRESIRFSALIPLYELSKSFMGMTDLERLLAEIVEVGCRETGADRASLMLVNDNGQTMTIKAAVGLPQEVMETTIIRVGEGISGIVAQRRQAVVLDNASSPGAEFRELMKRDFISSAICIPLTVRDDLVGVLNLSKLGHDTPPFTSDSLELASVLAGQAAIAIKNAHLFQETQRAYTELKKLDELKSEFINVASHELRTPLTVLMGYASLLDEQADETTKKYTQAVLQSAVQLNKLVTEMLNLRYLDAGEMKLELQPVQVSQVAQAVVQEMSFLAEGKEQSLTLDVPQDLPSIWADASMVRLVLSNLVSNGIKFTPEGGKIEIAARMMEDGLTMSVRDTGIGIAADELERVFDRFYQVGESLRREYPGLGLGLSIVKELVELHRGKVWVESRVGEGSTFFFTISRHLAPSSTTDQMLRKDVG
jgi:signal transduction histidine kinase/DNA-binding NarL/FixJ family response regulator